jgi:hypothetical protein
LIEEAGRLLRVFVAPGETFRAIRERPTWVLGFMLYWALASGAGFLLVSRVDFVEVMESQFAAQGRQAPANVEQSVGLVRGCATVGTVLAPPVVCLILALIFLSFRLFGGDFNYRQSLAITVHGLMPRAAAALASIPVILSRESFTADEMKSASFLYSNLTFLAPENAPAWQSVLLGSLDIFTLATLVLLSIGYCEAGKVPGKRAFLGVFGLWLIAVAVQVGLAALQGPR